MTKKKKPLLGTEKDKLLVALLSDDLCNALNTVCKTRGLVFHLSYLTQNPRLEICRKGGEPELFMSCNARTKQCFFHFPVDENLQLAVQDLADRLAKLDARLMLSVQRDKNSKPWAKVQLLVDGSRGIALTVLDTPKGRHITDSNFHLLGDEPNEAPQT